MISLFNYQLASSGATIDVINTELWVLRTNISSAVLTLKRRNENRQMALPPNKYFFIAISAGTTCVIAGGVYYKKVDFRGLTKLQAFIDFSKNRSLTFNSAVLWGLFPVDGDFELDSKELEYWFIRMNVESSKEFILFIDVLKNTEWYRLVFFLLEMSNSDCNRSLREISAMYGVSVSHFRRLCRSALGNSTKVELRDWRLSRAIVELMGGKKNITEIAMKHGYSSLSHFSNEVKSEYGVSPAELKKILIRKVTR